MAKYGWQSLVGEGVPVNNAHICTMYKCRCQRLSGTSLYKGDKYGNRAEPLENVVRAPKCVVEYKI